MFRNSSNWLASGILIIPAVAVLGIVLWAVTLGAFNPLFWLILPSIMFEQLIEGYSQSLSDSQLANLTFTLAFWFTVGAGTGWMSSLLRRSPN